ncbi:MAG: ImmA/IrrE family metallo-endopeptidase, partial [Acidimicrobiaceae bacterium]|nr:ImmA/IrrE family metallo-endopeptidase [Acidimicrobiaceae bacterium]
MSEDIVMMSVDGREREYRTIIANGIPVVVGYGAQLAFCDLSGADLSGLDLSFANMRGAELTFTNLEGCNLSFADLSEANAIGANIRNANLRGAVTENASLTFADLRGATYDQHSVRGAFISDDLTQEYLASLGIGPVDDALEADASILPVEGLDETRPEPATLEGDARVAVEPELATNVALGEIGVEDEGELVSSSSLADLLADAAPGSVVAASSRSSLARGGRSRDYSELLEGLSAGIAELTTSEKWTQYLDVQSKFYRYSPNNVMLLMMQNPYATRVAGYKKWLELGRQVMAKESALRILAPMTYQKDNLEGEKTSEIRGFKMVPVFDISQTEGPDLPDIVSKLQGLAPEGVFKKLKDFANTIGFRVERPESLDSGANGDTSHVSGLIRVVSSNSEAQQAKTLAHEIGHALLHDPGVDSTKELTRGLKELEAESAAYVICTALGMDTSDYSFGYV